MEKIEIINKIWENRDLLSTADAKKAIYEIIENLDKGKIRVANPTQEGWVVNEWIKKAVILYFTITPLRKKIGRASCRERV